MENPQSAPHLGVGAAMDGKAAEMVARARSGVYPSDWYVWPMQRNKVRRGLIRWGVYTVGGFLLFVPALFIMIPENFSHDGGTATASLVVLILLAATAFGSLYYFVFDLRRVLSADEHLLVMTPDDFVRAAPGRVTHVLMDNVSNITLKGVRNPGSPLYSPQTVRRSSMSMLLYPQRSSVSPSPFRAPLLTFRDTRTKAIITLTQDDNFDDLRALEEVLSTFVDEKVKARKALLGNPA